jgi:hypothetical protein
MPANLDSAAVFTFSTIAVPYSGPYNITKVSIAWLCDSGDGSFVTASFPAADMPDILGKSCYFVITNPGTPAPTDDYDITISDANGLSVFGTQLNDRDTANTEQIAPVISSVYAPRLCVDQWTFALANNSVNSAVGVCDLYFKY